MKINLFEYISRTFRALFFPVDPRLNPEFESFADGCERMKKEIEMKGKMNNED